MIDVPRHLKLTEQKLFMKRLHNFKPGANCTKGTVEVFLRMYENGDDKLVIIAVFILVFLTCKHYLQMKLLENNNHGEKELTPKHFQAIESKP